MGLWLWGVVYKFLKKLRSCSFMKKILKRELILLLKVWIILILSFILYFWLFFFTTYIHETGHILFGFGDSLIKGKITHFSIGNFINHPLTPFILLPQQAKIVSGEGSLNFILGGPFFNMIVFFGLSLLGYKISKNKLWFLLFISIVLFEVSGNIICGTDNLYGGPLSICLPVLDKYIQYFSIFLFSGVLFWLTLIRLKSYIEKHKG